LDDPCGTERPRLCVSQDGHYRIIPDHAGDVSAVKIRIGLAGSDSSVQCVAFRAQTFRARTQANEISFSGSEIRDDAF
jgi:hypothetical protein